MSFHILVSLTNISAGISGIWTTGSSNVPKSKLSNTHKRGLIPAPIGILPLDRFIYILIGSLVFLCCSMSLWAIFKAVKYPKLYLETMSSEEKSFVTTTTYKERKPLAPSIVSDKARDEVVKLRDDTKYQWHGSSKLSLGENPNLPIPVATGAVDTGESCVGIDSYDIEAWGNLVREKKILNITIANLERVAQARKQTGNNGSTNSRLLAATRRRAEVQNLINATHERFRERKTEWSLEEWQVVELIMQTSPQ